MEKSNFKPKVSIITVCLNSQKFIERTIQSVLFQTYPNLEYCIIDGGSQDATLKIIEKYRKYIDVLVSEPDNGIYDAQNKGIKMSSGQIIIVMNSDDRFYNNTIVEKSVDFFVRSRADFVYGDILATDTANSQACLTRFPDRLTKMYFLRGPLGHSATLVSRDCFLKAGYYDTRFKIAADYEWYLRALYKYRLRSAHFKGIISVFQEEGKSSNFESRLSEMNDILKVYFNPLELSIGKFINYVFCGGLMRFIAMIVLRKSGYDSLRILKRKSVSAKYN